MNTRRVSCGVVTGILNIIYKNIFALEQRHKQNLACMSMKNNNRQLSCKSPQAEKNQQSEGS
jgi:hypothetical protein